MKKKKSLLLAVLCVLLIAAACIGGAIHIWNEFSDYSNCIKANWGFSLPKESDYTQIYQKDDGASPHGDGLRYHVFSYEQAAPIESMILWRTEEGATRHYGGYSKAADRWLNALDVPTQERPNYPNCVYSYQTTADGSEMLLFLDKAMSRLYVVESFL